jgi:hypothetical protein
MPRFYKDGGVCVRVYGASPQEERLIEADFSINLKAEYLLNGATRKSYINIVNARRGVLLIGSPGSGKSWFIIEPAMEQLIAKGFSMLVLDFKYDTLTRTAYSCSINTGNSIQRWRVFIPSTSQTCPGAIDVT